MSNIVHIILAAGNSSRMGKPKQLLPWKDTFLLDYVINTIEKTNHKKIVLVLGSNYDIVEPKVNHKAIEIVYNQEWNQGLGTSIVKGVSTVLKNNSPDAILISLADQPLIPVSYFNQIINNCYGKSNQIIASNYGNNKLGVPALFGSDYFGELSKLQTDKGAKSIIAKNMEHVHALDAQDYLSDIDTMEAYNKLYAANHQ